MKKFFTKEVKIALTAIVAIALMFYLINFMKGINIFKSSNTYHVVFSDIQGLSISSPVYANGYSVGIVRDIDYNYTNPGHVVVNIELDKEMRVPQGTYAELVNSLMGGVTMNLILSSNPIKHIAPGDTIHGDIYRGAIDKVGEMMPTIERMVPKLDSILASLNKLLADPALAASLHNIERTTANLESGSAQLNNILNNDVPQLTRRLNNIGDNVNTFTANLKHTDVAATMKIVDNTLQQVNETTKNLNDRLSSKDNSLGLLLNDRSLYNNLDSTVNSANSLLIDLRTHPKRYVHFSVFGRKDK